MILLIYLLLNSGLLNALLGTFYCAYLEIMFTIISFFPKSMRGWDKSGGLENFSKINKRGGTIIRYSRVGKEPVSVREV